MLLWKNKLSLFCYILIREGRDEFDRHYGCLLTDLFVYLRWLFGRDLISDTEKALVQNEIF